MLYFCCVNLFTCGFSRFCYCYCCVAGQTCFKSKQALAPPTFTRPLEPGAGGLISLIFLKKYKQTFSLKGPWIITCPFGFSDLTTALIYTNDPSTTCNRYLPTYANSQNLDSYINVSKVDGKYVDTI